MHDISLGFLNEPLKLWKADFVMFLNDYCFSTLLPNVSHLLILCALFLNPVVPGLFLFLQSLHLLWRSFPPCVVYFFSLFICLLEDSSNQLTAIISISSLLIKSLTYSAFINITICLSGIPLFSLIWWLYSYTHISLIGWANGTAAVESQLRWWWDVVEMCNTVAHYYHRYTKFCALGGCKPAPTSTCWCSLNPSEHTNLPRDATRSASSLNCRAFSPLLSLFACERVLPWLYSTLGLRGTVSNAFWQMFKSCHLVTQKQRQESMFASVYERKRGCIVPISLQRLLLSRCINSWLLLLNPLMYSNVL